MRGTLDRLGLAESPLTRRLRYRFVSDLSPQAGRGKAAASSANTASRSRGRIRPSLAPNFPPSSQRAQGMPGARCAPRSRVQNRWKNAHEHTGHTGIDRHSPRNGFNGFLRALPGDRAFLPPSPLRSSLLKNLTPASGRQNHATSPSASCIARQARTQRPPHPAPRFVTLRNAPLRSGTVADIG